MFKSVPTYQSFWFVKLGATAENVPMAMGVPFTVIEARSAVGAIGNCAAKSFTC